MPKANFFAETQSRFVLSVKPADQAAFEALVPQAFVAGQVTDNGMITIKGIDGAISLGVSTAKELWEEAIPCLMK